MPWLNPWVKDLAHCNENLGKARETFTKILLSEKVDPADVDAAKQAIEAAQKMYSLVQPVYLSVQAATAGLANKS
eukprot:3846028-Alexandrium_andersonii.AAC.1